MKICHKVKRYEKREKKEKLKEKEREGVLVLVKSCHCTTTSGQKVFLLTQDVPNKLKRTQCKNNSKGTEKLVEQLTFAFP